jgi:hypothetical protein
VLVPSLNLAPALEFERSDATRRLRLVLAELIVIMGQVLMLFYAFISSLISWHDFDIMVPNNGDSQSVDFELQIQFGKLLRISWHAKTENLHHTFQVAHASQGKAQYQ